MRMGQQHEIQLRRADGQLLIDKEVLPLLHTAVHQTTLVPNFEIGTAAGHLMRRAKKCYFHQYLLLSVNYPLFSAVILHQL